MCLYIRQCIYLSDWLPFPIINKLWTNHKYESFAIFQLSLKNLASHSIPTDIIYSHAFHRGKLSHVCHQTVLWLLQVKSCLHCSGTHCHEARRIWSHIWVSHLGLTFTGACPTFSHTGLLKVLILPWIWAPDESGPKPPFNISSH